VEFPCPLSSSFLQILRAVDSYRALRAPDGDGLAGRDLQKSSDSDGSGYEQKCKVSGGWIHLLV
jgi:hypothetical protein